MLSPQQQTALDTLIRTTPFPRLQVYAHNKMTDDNALEVVGELITMSWSKIVDRFDSETLDSMIEEINKHIELAVIAGIDEHYINDLRLTREKMSE